jgi:hypothetical protein
MKQSWQIMLKEFKNKIKNYCLQYLSLLVLPKKELLSQSPKPNSLVSNKLTVLPTQQPSVGTLINLLDYDIKIRDITANIKDLNRQMNSSVSTLELYELGKRVRNEVSNLRIVLESYFQFEREQNVPINFAYRTIYRTLKKFKTI